VKPTVGPAAVVEQLGQASLTLHRLIRGAVPAFLDALPNAAASGLFKFTLRPQMICVSTALGSGGWIGSFGARRAVGKQIAVPSRAISA